MEVVTTLLRLHVSVGGNQPECTVSLEDNGLTRRTPWWHTDDKVAFKEALSAVIIGTFISKVRQSFDVPTACNRSSASSCHSPANIQLDVSARVKASQVFDISTDLNSSGNYRWRNGNYCTTWKIGQRLETASVRLFEVKDNSSQLWCVMWKYIHSAAGATVREFFFFLA